MHKATIPAVISVSDKWQMPEMSQSSESGKETAGQTNRNGENLTEITNQSQHAARRQGQLAGDFNRHPQLKILTN